MTTTRMDLAQALNQALHEELSRDDSTLLIGEDIGQGAGLFGVTDGLLPRFGSQRIIDAPISEAGIAGFGVGAALVGARPVVEVQIADFFTLMADAIVNHAAKWRYMSGGRATMPVVFRGPVSSGIGMGAQHSQSLESWFMNCPGLVVLMPSNPADAKGLLKSAIRDDNPVVFFEKRLLYPRRGEVPDGEHIVPIGVADVKRGGGDITMVSAGHGVNLALQAANRLARDHDVDVEVVDLRSLKPLDIDTVHRSVRKTGRLVVLSEASPMCGFASEVLAQVCEVGWSWLRANPVRVTAADAPMPYAEPLEHAIMPGLDRVIEAVIRTCGA